MEGENEVRKLEREKGIYKFLFTEAALQKCSYKKVFWKYSANLLEKTHAEVWFP